MLRLSPLPRIGRVGNRNGTRPGPRRSGRGTPASRNRIDAPSSGTLSPRTGNPCGSLRHVRVPGADRSRNQWNAPVLEAEPELRKFRVQGKGLWPQTDTPSVSPPHLLRVRPDTPMRRAALVVDHRRDRGGGSDLYRVQVTDPILDASLLVATPLCGSIPEGCSAPRAVFLTYIHLFIYSATQMNIWVVSDDQSAHQKTRWNQYRD